MRPGAAGWLQIGVGQMMLMMLIAGDFERAMRKTQQIGPAVVVVVVDAVVVTWQVSRVSPEQLSMLSSLPGQFLTSR